MLRGEFDAADASATELRDAYASTLREVVEAVGVETVVAESDLSRETVEALAAGETPELTLSEAAAVLSLSPSRPDADTIRQDALDVLLMGMSVAVVDVDTVASRLDGGLEAKEIQAKVEGRRPVTLAEYARLHRFVERNK
ncbi:MAG: DUF5791 family protein [Haloarculaceae archaeon]